MATREFTDSKGVVWRAWDVRPSRMHPATRAEEFMEPWAGGWLAFESASEKRRLVAPYPPRWFDYDLPKLEVLLKEAKRVTGRRLNSPTSVELVRVEAAAHDHEWAENERTFTSPRGRLWVVRIHECTGRDQEHQVVLRFTSGDSVVDLKDWPPNWKDLGREDFALMLLDAEPPRRKGKGELPQRRREDRPIR